MSGGPFTFVLMRWQQTTDVERYAAAVREFLESEPCSRNVLRWIIQLAREGAGNWTANPEFAWHEADGVVAAAASWAPPFNLLVSTMPEAAAAELIALMNAAAVARGVAVSGVTGPAASATAVAAAWEQLTRGRARLHMEEQLYALTAVREVPLPQGRRRTARRADAATLVDWLLAFSAEVGLPTAASPDQYIRHMTDTDQLDVWVVGGSLVSMAGHRSPVAGVVRVGPVYTPPDHRGRGFARRLVAELSAAALAQAGVHHCMLYADLANSVANSIYQQIGYAPREIHRDYAFE